MAGIDRYASSVPRVIPDWEAEKVQDTLRLFSELQNYRNIHAASWEETARLILPTSANTFFYGSYNWPGLKRTEFQVDASGALALTRFVALINSLVTPRNIQWHGLKAGGPNGDYIMKDRDTRLWFERTTRQLFAQRYAPSANFFAQNKANWTSIGAFGNATMYIDPLDGFLHHGLRGLRYRGLPLGETFFAENHQGIVTTMARWFRGTAEQAAQKWGTKALPPALWNAAKLQLQQPFNFLHCVKPRDIDDYDPKRLDEKGKPFESYYVSIEGACLMGPEGGYRVFPFAVSRFEQTPGEVYARGPAQVVLPALKTLNAQKRTSLKVGHRNADPVYLINDDGLLSGFDQRPGALNKGGVSADGKPLVHAMIPGNYEVSKEQMAMEREIIDDTFLSSLLKFFFENPNMTATQVIEIVNERGMLLAPTVGGQFEYVSQMVEREIDLLADMKFLDPMPPRLREARGQYQVVDTSPLAMMARTGEVAGAIRILEQVREIVNITQDVSILDPIDFDAMVPEAAEIQGMPTRWMCDAKKIADKRKARAQSLQRKQQIEAMPAQAAIMKAQAVQAKSGLPTTQQTPAIQPGAA